MKPNIFLYKNLTNEDHFTNSLGYLLNLFPKELGDRFLSKLSRIAGYPIGYFGKFEKSEFTGHHFQNDDSTSKPDMIIHTNKHKLFIEIKLSAPLSAFQLERHLNDVKKVKGKLILISNVHTQVSKEVIAQKNYLKPTNQNHFFWTDFEPVFNSKIRKNSLRDLLLSDFKQSLRSNGIKGRQIMGAKDNLYANGSAAENMFLDNLKAVLKNIGFSAWRPNREYTLRVNPHKIGFDPLLNPRIHCSGEFIHEKWVEECMIINCFSDNFGNNAKKIRNLKTLKKHFNTIEYFEYNRGDRLIVLLYVPLKFKKVEGNFFEFDWESIQRIWESIYEIVK